MKYKYPVAFCPCCRRPVIYSGDPKDKNLISVTVADETYDGRSILCAKCKNMLIITEKSRTAVPRNRIADGTGIYA